MTEFTIKCSVMLQMMKTMLNDIRRNNKSTITSELKSVPSNLRNPIPIDALSTHPCECV